MSIKNMLTYLANKDYSKQLNEKIDRLINNR